MNSVEIVEVGPRDGLQNEKTKLDSQVKAEFIQRLLEAGIRKLEMGAFVSPEWVPQMADTPEVFALVQKMAPKRLWAKAYPGLTALVPNRQGMNKALDLGFPEVAIFASASESFSKKNINCSIRESFERFIPVMELAKKSKVRVRAHLSVAFGCPYEGKVSEAKVVNLAEKLVQLGCYQVSIADTIGIAHVGQIDSVFRKLKKKINVKKLAGHFHDTRGQALANVLTAYHLGVRVFDSSLGGLGGCPYAPGASGNLATEDLVYMLQGLGAKTGIDLNKLIETNQWLSLKMGKPLPSLVSRATGS